MHSWTRRATRSWAHTGGGLLQNPSSSLTRLGHFSVCFTQQPSRCTMRTEVQAKSAGNTAATAANRIIFPPRHPRACAGGPALRSRERDSEREQPIVRVGEQRSCLSGGRPPGRSQGAAVSWWIQLVQRPAHV